jgi:type I restriction enzyme M protein
MYDSLRPSFEQTNAPFELFQMIIEAVVAGLGSRRLLLLLDEFDKVQDGIENGITSPQVPDNFRNLFHTYPQVSAILTGSQLMKRLRREYFNPLFGIGRPIPIGPLDLVAARELVVKPVRNVLVYSDVAREWIVEACACQPFLIQHVCSRVFDICADAEETNVTTDTVKKAAEIWLKTDTHFDTVWRDDIHDPRRQYIAWLVYELQSGPDPVTFELLRQTLEKRGLYGSTALTGYLEDLRDLAVIRQQEKDRVHTYTISIPLFAQWLRVRIDPSQYLTKALNEDGGKL